MDSFVLHTCCAPCGVAVIDELRKKYDLTVYFYNPNIFPETEYKKRKAEIVKLCIEWNVTMIDGDYETALWDEKTAGLIDEPEGGARCRVCFALRLQKAAILAKSLDAEFFGTTLTMGRNKNAAVINHIGRAFGQKHGVKFFEEDWKKNGRQEVARQMIAERNIYRQNYCGCRYSLNSPRRSKFYFTNASHKAAIAQPKT